MPIPDGLEGVSAGTAARAQRRRHSGSGMGLGAGWEADGGATRVVVGAKVMMELRVQVA